MLESLTDVVVVGWPIFALVADLSIKLILVSTILLRRSHGRSRLPWIALILALPFVGLFAYLIVGAPRLGARRRARHAAITKNLAPRLGRYLVERKATAEVPEIYAPLVTLAESVGQDIAVAGNQLALLSEADEFVRRLVDDIDAADEHCHLLYYIVLPDDAGRRITEALIRAAKRGVTCRLLVDAVGSRPYMNSPMPKQLRAAGVHVVEAMPAHLLRLAFARLDLRNHRKIAVIDGWIGYMGSHNVADSAFAIKAKYAPWVDATVRIDGAAAAQLQRLFAVDWHLETGETLEETFPRAVVNDEGQLCPLPPDDDLFVTGKIAQVIGTGPNSATEALRELLVAAMYTARDELIITTPYFVPDEAAASALSSAARRGVTTRLIVPTRNDSPLVAAASRSFYEPLLEAGVEIHEYQRGLLHAKTMIVDRNLAVISSANLDRRSFELNFEVSMMVYDDDFASQLRFLQATYLNDSRRIHLAEWRERRLPARLWHNVAGLFGPLL